MKAFRMMLAVASVFGLLAVSPAMAITDCDDYDCVSDPTTGDPSSLSGCLDIGGEIQVCGDLNVPEGCVCIQGSCSCLPPEA